MIISRIRLNFISVKNILKVPDDDILNLTVKFSPVNAWHALLPGLQSELKSLGEIKMRKLAETASTSGHAPHRPNNWTSTTPEAQAQQAATLEAQGDAGRVDKSPSGKLIPLPNDVFLEAWDLPHLMNYERQTHFQELHSLCPHLTYDRLIHGVDAILQVTMGIQLRETEPAM